MLCSKVVLSSTLPTDPYQPNRRLALSSSASAVITVSPETLRETQSIGSVSLGARMSE